MSNVLIGLAPFVALRMEMVLVPPGMLARLPRWVTFAQGAVIWIAVGVYTLAIARRRLGRWPRLPRVRAVCVEAGWAVLAVVVTLLAVGLISPYVAWLFGESEGRPHPLTPLARSTDRYQYLMFATLALGFAPVAEEVYFRGALFNWLRQWLPVIPAAVLQALAFGLLHPFDLMFATIIAILGLMIGLLYEWRKTLLAPILMHMMTNAFGLLVIGLGLAPGADAPQLGVRGLEHAQGCVISEVTPASAADLAGIRVGDTVTAIDGTAVTDLASLRRIVLTKKPGDTVTVEFLRAGLAHRVEAILQKATN